MDAATRWHTLLHEAYPGGKWIVPMLSHPLGEHLLQVELERDDDGALMGLVFGVPETRGEVLPS